ncbi:Ovarian cancer-associated protein 2, partial [Cichlidogyrus casuarinus]
ILCLHGYRQSAKVFKEKSGKFRKQMQKQLPSIEFTFIDAPHVVESSNQESRAWWFSRSDRTYSSKDAGDETIGLEETIKFLTERIDILGPFDGVLAFSQGAALAIHLQALIAQEKLSFPNIRFFILVAPFFIQTPVYHSMYRTLAVKLPTLIVSGVNDLVIPPERTAETHKLYQGCNSMTLLSHSGGHILAIDAENKDVYIDFIQKFCGSNTPSS